MEHLEQTIKKYDLEYQRFQNGLNAMRWLLNFFCIFENYFLFSEIFFLEYNEIR